jgi:hypothetical protein
MPNHVDLNNPVVNIRDAYVGKIFSAQSARSMQLGLKIVF